VFVALGIQPVMRMRRIILPFVASRLYKIFPYYLINDTIFREKKIIEHKMCVLVCLTTLGCNISRDKKQLSEI
jgi:hypothetical protein